MLLLKSSWLACLLAVFAVSSLGFAGEPAATPSAAKPAEAKPASETKPAPKETKPAANESIDQLVEKLDSAEFDQRETATTKLAQKGKEAIPALEKAAATGDLEVSGRALGVLGKFFKGSDEPTSKQAGEALKRLSEGDGRAAPKAKSLLEKKEQSANNNSPFGPGGMAFPMPGPGGFGGGRIVINGGVLQIGGGAAMKTMSVTNNNGVRQIKASEGDKSVKIDDDPNKGIKIEVTDKVNGKEVTKKYEAKNVDDLKKNQPEGYKVYKEYGEQQNGAVQLQIQGNAQLQPGFMPAIPLQPALPAIPGVAPAPNVVPAAGNGMQIDRAIMRLKVMSAQLESLRKNETYKDVPAAKKAELKKQIDELSQQIDQVKKQLDGK